MNYTIENNKLYVSIALKGAEIKTIKYLNHDYLHDSNPQFWNRSAPILWPNIGAIKNNKTIINGKEYPLTKHGFLRDLIFTVTKQEATLIEFTVCDNCDTLKKYPFKFNIQVTYELDDDKIKSSIKITNKDEKNMPFNLGLHPAFKLPLEEKYTREDYKLVFNDGGTYELPTVNLENGTIDFTNKYRKFTNLIEIPFNHEDYKQDAMIFDNLRTQTITLTDKNNEHGITFNFPDFKMVGIWTPYPIKAPFVCIEPWIGCADAPSTDGQFTSKRDLITIATNDSKTINYNIKFF